MSINEATPEQWDSLNRMAKLCPTPEPPVPVEVRSHNVGASDYAEHKIQPWDIWEEYNLDPWDADIIKRVLRNKKGYSKREDYEKIRHICDEKIRQLNAYNKSERKYTNEDNQR